MMISNEVEGIVLSCDEYREHDGLITLLKEDEIIRFIARGIHKQNSKNRMLTQPYTFVHIELAGRNQFTMTTGHVIKSYYRIYDDLKAQAVLSVLVDCLKRSEMNAYKFEVFTKVLESFHDGLANVYTYACICMKEICKSEGFGMHVDDCVLCHRKNGIETISILDGGFLCRSCNHGNIRKYSKEDLIQYRSLFVYRYEQFSQFVDMYIFTLDDFMFLVRWYMNHSALELKSYQFLKSVCVL